MLEKLPSAIGHLLEGVRPGLDKTVYHDPRLANVLPVIAVSSPAFGDGAPLDARFTEDGAGVSPPLEWSKAPAGSSTVIIIVEDADSPTPAPLVHAIVYGLTGTAGVLPEGAISSDQPLVATGRNSFMKSAWLPCDPPSGHGPHRYVFQVYALDAVPEFAEHPSRGDIETALAARAIAKGVLIGTYERT